VAVTGQGNVVVNTVQAQISGGSTVAVGDVILSAEDEAPVSMLPDWMISEEQQEALDEYLKTRPSI
jgi:hypothetical protein